MLDPETAKLIQELQNHQIELELQNKELISANKRAQLASEKFAELYDFAPSGYFTLSAEGVIIELNLCASQMLGKARNNLINSSFIFFVAEDNKDIFFELLDRIFSTKGKEFCELALQGVGMVPIFVQLTGIISSNGESCLISVTDITSRKAAEDQLLKSRLLMKSSLESQKEMILLSVDLEYRYLYFNPAHSEIMKTAYGSHIEVGLNILDYITSDNEKVLTKEYFERSLNGESHMRVWKFDNGLPNYYESFFSPIFDENSKIIGVTAFSRDITDRRRSEELLQESKVRLDTTQQMVHLGSWELDNSTGQLFWSDEVFRILGFLPQEFEANISAFMELVYPDDRDAVNSVYYTLIENIKPGFEIEHRIVRRNTGEVRYVYEKCEHIFNQSGQIIKSVGLLQDITERKLAELALIESEEKFRSFVQYSSDPIFSFNHDETYRFVNESFARQFGKYPQEVVGKSPYELFPADEAERRLSLVRHVIETGKKGEIDVKIVAPSQEIRYFLTTADPYVDEHGHVLYVNCVSKDITQQKNSEKALQESEAQITAILGAIPDMIFILNDQGVYLDYCGPMSPDLYMQPEMFIGKSIEEVLPEELYQLFAVAFKTALQTREIQLCEYSLNLPDGMNYFEAKVVAYAESKLLTITRNVSIYKRAEATIKLKNDDLIRINAEKDKFFSIIAHDLRGPFSGFLGLTETLAKRLPDMTLKEIHEITLLMRNSAVHLFRLLGNLLEWSRMKGGLIAFNPKKILLEPKLSQFLDVANEMAHLKDIKIKHKSAKGLMIYADENMLESIIRNLLSNAVKFTPRGGKVSVSAKLNSDNSVTITIEDSGIGMNSLLIDQLFRIDKRSNRKGTEGENSTGLGLILSKDFIEKHGGNLSVESVEGIGSTFYFTLPGFPPVLD